jgi:hypothetical protein
MGRSFHFPSKIHFYENQERLIKTLRVRSDNAGKASSRVGWDTLQLGLIFSTITDHEAFSQVQNS